MFSEGVCTTALMSHFDVSLRVVQWVGLGHPWVVSARSGWSLPTNRIPSSCPRVAVLVEPEKRCDG